MQSAGLGACAVQGTQTDIVQLNGALDAPRCRYISGYRVSSGLGP
jgi:hypothetical protein